MGTGVHLDVSLNVGHDDPPQLGDKVTLLVLVLVPLFVLHLPGGAEHDPQADQLLTWMKIYIYKSNTVEPLLWDTSFQGRRHYFWVPQRALQVRLPWWGIWTVDVICAELGVIQRKFIFYIGWLRMNLNELIYHLRTILNCTWQSLRQQGPRQDFVCVSVGQGVPLQEAAVVTRRLRLCWPLLSQRALQDPQLDHELTTQFTGQHLTI